MIMHSCVGNSPPNGKVASDRRVIRVCNRSLRGRHRSSRKQMSLCLRSIQKRRASTSGLGPISLKKSVSNLRLIRPAIRDRRLRAADGLRLGEDLASVSASRAFGGFGRLLREGTHRAHHSAPLV